MTFRDEYHDLACKRLPDGTLACRCRPLVVRESRAGARATCENGQYHGEVGHTLESVAVPVSCSPRRRGRSRSIEVSR